MTISTTYLLNVALHAAILSVFATFALLVMRQARHRSVTAIAGLLAVGFLPWLTALRPARPVAAPVPEIQIQSPSLPTWTVVTLPMERENTPKPAELSVAPPKFVFPDPLTATVMTWAAGSGTGIFLLVCAMLRLRIWRKSLSPPDDPAWETLRSLSPEIPDRRHFLISQGTASPCVTGFFQSRIVLPRFLLSSASEEELRWAVRHEIAHWQAGDSRWTIVFAVVRCMNWWNPFVHQLVSRWVDAREQLCDLHATGMSDSRADYGEFLVAMARQSHKQPPLAVSMAERSHARRLKRRIISLLESTTNSGNPAGKTFITTSSFILIVCAVLISSVKIDAEEPVKRSVAVPESTGVAQQLAASLPTKTPDIPQPPIHAPKGIRQVKFTTTFVLRDLMSDYEVGFSESMTKEGRFTIASCFSDHQQKIMMKSFSQKRGISLCTGPSVTAKSDESATMKIIREIPGTPEQIAKRAPKSEIPFVGIFLTYSPRFSDETRDPTLNSLPDLDVSTGMIEFEQNMEYRFVPGIFQPLVDINAKPPNPLNPDVIKTIKRSINGRIPSGFTVCSDLGEIESGKFLTIFTRVDAIDTNGHPIDMKKLSDERQNRESIIVDTRRAKEGTLPLAEVRGSLRLDATLVDLPLTKPRPPGEGLVIGLTPTIKSVADKILTTRGGGIRKLKTIDVPLNERVTPWPECPQLSLTAIASKNHQVISITSHAVGSGEEDFPNTWQQIPGDVMNFGIRTADTSIERRLLITIEGVK